MKRPGPRRPTGPERPAGPRRGEARPRGPAPRPPLSLFTTTLWEYPSQHYDSPTGERQQGSKDYAGATPSWIIWQLLARYTREGDLVVDPFCGSGTTIDVCRDLKRRVLGYDLNPARPDIFRADARRLPLEDAKADFVFMDPPYAAHISYSSDADDIGSLDVHGDDGGRAYFEAMERAFAEAYRVLRDRRFMAVYVSDSFRKPRGPGGLDRTGFVPIGFELFSMLRRRFQPAEIVAVARHNQKLRRGNWHAAAEEGNFFLRGFNYLFIMRKLASYRGAEPPRRS